MPPLPRVRAALPVLLAACSYDGSGLTGLDLPTASGTTGEASTSTADPSTTTGPALTTDTPDPTTGTTSPVDPTTSTSGPDTTSTTDLSTTSTTEPDTTDTTDTTGEPPPMLIDDGLIVRYFLDEAADGQAPTLARDAAPDPLDLPLVYSSMSGGNPVYAEPGGHRGLTWPMAGLDGRATTSVGGTKVQTRLDARTTATIEVVVDIDAVHNQGSRISHIGAGSSPGHFTLRSRDIGRLEFFWKNDVLAGVWPVDWVGLGRVVVHLVVDTGQPDAIHRVRLYIDGQAVADGVDGMLVTPTQFESIFIPAGDPNLHYTLGNRGVDVDRSFQGALFYAALYDVALSEPQLQHNAAALAVSDDGG